MLRIEIKSQPSITTVSCKYGAPMGRTEFYNNPTGRVTTFRVRINSGGYDRGGAYWGIDDPLYCQCEVNEAMGFRLFTRAKSKAEALKIFTEIRRNKGICLPISLDAWIKDRKFSIDRAMIREYGTCLNLHPTTRLNHGNRRTFVLNNEYMRDLARGMNVTEVQQ
jgi:hypothetical protein